MSSQTIEALSRQCAPPSPQKDQRWGIGRATIGMRSPVRVFPTDARSPDSPWVIAFLSRVHSSESYPSSPGVKQM